MIGSIGRRIGAALGCVVVATAMSAAVASPAQALDVPYGHVYNYASPRCLDSGVVANAQLWNCSNSIYQQWRYSHTGAIKGNSPPGCLDDGAGLNGSGAALVACNGSSHQIWYGNATGGTFVNAASGRCLDADLGTIGGQATKVQVWDCSGGYNQVWAFEFS